MKQTIGANFRFVELANDINDHMPEYVAPRVAIALNRDAKAVNGSLILVLGLSYKRNSGDIRVSPVPVLCDRLVALGAHLRAVDPHVAQEHFPPKVKAVELTEDELKAADLVVVATDHGSYDWELVRGSARRVFDTRRRLRYGAGVELL